MLCDQDVDAMLKDSSVFIKLLCVTFPEACNYPRVVIGVGRRGRLRRSRRRNCQRRWGYRGAAVQGRGREAQVQAAVDRCRLHRLLVLFPARVAASADARPALWRPVVRVRRPQSDERGRPRGGRPLGRASHPYG